MWQKVALLILACAGGLYAQNPNPCRQVQNAATSGQVLSASSSGSTPTCKWIAAGGGGGGGTVTEIDTTLPITGGPITTTGAIGCRTATGAVSGCLSAADWTTFNSKQAAGSYVLTTRSIATTAPLAGGGDLSADRTLTCNAASGSQPGCLSAADWTTFNGKQAAGAYATCTGDLSGTAPGCTVSKINGTSFAGTSGHLVSFGAANIPADSGLVAANQVNASSPGVGLCHFAGSTQTCTSSLVVAADITSATITGTQIASSIALAGSPTTTTQSPGDNSTKIATTAYVNAASGGSPGGSFSEIQYRGGSSTFGAMTNTAPVPTASWTKVNCATALCTVDDFAADMMGFKVDGHAGTAWGAAIQSLGSAPYTVIARMKIGVINNNSSSQVAGLCLYDGTKLYSIANNYNAAAQVSVETRQTANVSSAGTAANTTASVTGDLVTFKINDNSTNRIWSYWSNGTWVQLLSETTATFLTPNAVGPCALDLVVNANQIDIGVSYWCVASGNTCNGQ